MMLNLLNNQQLANNKQSKWTTLQIFAKPLDSESMKRWFTFWVNMANSILLIESNRYTSGRWWKQQLLNKSTFQVTPSKGSNREGSFTVSIYPTIPTLVDGKEPKLNHDSKISESIFQWLQTSNQQKSWDHFIRPPNIEASRIYCR